MTILIIAVLSCMAIAAIWWFRWRRRRNYLQSEIDRYVADIFGESDFRPNAKTGWSYGMPLFELRFRSDQEVEAAESDGLIQQFIDKVQILCGDAKVPKRKFDAKLAVAVFSDEQVAQWERDGEDYRNR